MRAAVALALLVALVGCGPAKAPPAGPGVTQQEVEGIVNDLDSVVGSAESETATN